MAENPIHCPSARCTPGAILLGIVLPDGRVAYARDRVVIDREFVEVAQNGRPPEQRFRFSSPCVESGCRQWTGARCSVIDDVVDFAAAEATGPPSPDALPACSIRPTCRWFRQQGALACAVCPEIVTDQRGSQPAGVHPHAAGD
jgi:hypothetical protein